MSEPDAQLDALAAQLVNMAFRLHQDLGPGLLETAYETLLAAKLEREGFAVQRQVSIDACHDGIILPAAFRLDILVNQQIVLEIKSVEKMLPVHGKQLLTYLKLGHFPLGFVLNFGMPMFKDGIRRFINSDALLASSRLGANPSET